MQIIDIVVPELHEIEIPEGISDELRDKFLIPMYQDLHQKLDANTARYPHIEYEEAKIITENIINNLTTDEVKHLRKIGHGKGEIASGEWRKSPVSKALMTFLWVFPCFGNLILNIHLLADIVIKSTEFHLNEKISADNFINAKQLIDQVNRERWNRDQTPKEKQSGVSNLGAVSEALIQNALIDLIDNSNFFKTTNQKIKSYGDFVLMCLPNNLWISVKSNYARERLLASGYTTDILGVGFFTSQKEFISRSKIRNFQRVGFLAMYLPDMSISEDQVANGTNTYNEVMAFYNQPNNKPPVNINNTSFIRPLSSLVNDIRNLLAINEIANRTTLDF